MSLEHAILGFLNYHAYTGYDLKKIFDTSFGLPIRVKSTAPWRA